MQGSDLKEFRIVNNLTQTQLGEYLGIQKGFISKIENGREKLPMQKFRKLLNNPHNWDTSMLDTPLLGMDTLRESPKTFTRDHIHAAIESVMDPSTSFIVNYLERKVADLEKKVEELLKENAILKYESTMSKGEESADSAEDSSSANVG